ncbi:hypothetical protein KUTeg_006727 [Tegillarca granosa]|uniref:Uncharacterized protein n=1 Tax=Tegillarca granosa TaxID=220873 RepID=A0ABQ9FFE4_TEGGR|nr:hypothetical protein KUTeg_006727 [Tegillarca granosa]
MACLKWNRHSSHGGASCPLTINYDVIIVFSQESMKIMNVFANAMKFTYANHDNFIIEFARARMKL